MRVLLDTNVILDAMLQRAPWHQEADAILQAAANGQVTCAATTLTLATTFYVGRKAVGNRLLATECCCCCSEKETQCDLFCETVVIFQFH